MLVATQGACHFTLGTTDSSWLIPHVTSAVGSQKVYFTVRPNGGPWERSAKLLINGGEITITQGPAVATPGCFNGFFPGSATVSAQGGTYTIDASAPAECVWTTTTTSGDWLHNWTASGIGSGPLIYIVDPNPTNAPRTASIVVNGATFVVTQEAGPG